MALFDDIPVVGDALGGGNWVTGLAIGVGAVMILPLAAAILRPVAMSAIKGGLQAYQGVADLGAEAVAESGGELAEQAVEVTAEAAGTRPGRRAPLGS